MDEEKKMKKNPLDMLITIILIILILLVTSMFVGGSGIAIPFLTKSYSTSCVVGVSNPLILDSKITDISCSSREVSFCNPLSFYNLIGDEGVLEGTTDSGFKTRVDWSVIETESRTFDMDFCTSSKPSQISFSLKDKSNAIINTKIEVI